VSFDGTNFLVAWGVGMGSGGRIAAARLSQAGTLLDTTSLTLSTISSTYTEAQVRPALAFDGVNTLVAWEDIRNGSRDIYANRLTKAGQVLDGNGFVLATSANQKQLPKLAFDGTNTLAVWVDWIDTSTTNRDSSIVGRRVSPAGTLVDANPITISAAAGEQSDPAVAFDGTRYLVAWSDYRGADTDVYATRVGTDGTVVDPQGLPVIVAPAAQYTPELVFLAGKYFLAWVDSRGGRSSIYGARVGTDGVSVDGTGFPLPNVPNTQDTPAAASDGSRYFVVWADSRTDGPGIRGAHVTPEGQVVESTSLRVSTSPGYNSRPVVAWNGSVYLVVWSGDTRLLARRFSAAGTPLDAADIPIPSLALLSDVTSNGTDFLVVGNEVTGFDIQGVRVSGAGVLLDAAPISICAASGSQYNPRATFDGSDYFVIWPDRRDAQGHVYGARVTTAGTVLDPDGFLLSPPTGVTADYQSDPDVAFDGTNILVVWHDSRNYSIRGTRVTPAGALLDPTSAVIVSPASNLDVIGTPHVKFDGTNFVVSADHANFNSSNQIISYATTASRLTTTLATLDATSILSYPTEQLKVALASDRAGSTLFTWTLPTTLDGYPVNRVRARILSESTPAGGCTLPSQCTSGYCVDGFCCDTACGGGSMTDCLACSVGAGTAANGICGAVADGRGCNDANACTLGDTCHAGACQASSTVTCSALDACHMAGTCAVTTGLCSNPNQPNGTACPGGTCSAGSCGPASDGGNADGGDAGRDATAGGDARPDAGSSDGQPPLDAGGGGASGAGGSTGAGGSAGAGGAGGASGAAGASAGRGGGGGATAATGGNAAGGSAGGAAGGAGNISGASGSSGCGCATGPGPAAGLPVFAAGALVALVAARRRARRAPSRR
jgi:hypothetical protein